MKTRIVFFCSALALAMSGGALAQDAVQISRGFYGGLGIGKAKANLKRDDFISNISPFIEENKDETDTVYKFFVGYQFARYIAAELSYTDFGKFAYIYNFGGGAESRFNYKAKSWATSAVASIPLRNSGFSVLGRLGIAYNIAERSTLTGDVLSGDPAAEKKRLGFLWGFGGSYDFSPTLTMRLEYEDYGKFGEAQSDDGFFKSGRARIHMYSLNFIARF